MGGRIAAIALGSLAVLSSPVMADGAATVTEVVNDVRRGSSQAEITEIAPVGSKLADGQYLKTGVKSRAELQLANLTITRLGANTLFDYSPGSNEIDLQTGTVLFSKPKDSTQMTIKTAAVTAAVLGTTGFVQAHGKSFLFGLIEGHAQITINGVTYNLGPGDVLRLQPGAKPEIFAYNVPHFLETSPLLTAFTSKLPNQGYIDSEVARYDNLVARGFITPPTNPSYSTEEGSVSISPPLARDSSASSHYVSNVEAAPALRATIDGSGVVTHPARPPQPYGSN
jgi:mannose-6-phosphate isomerase-like protein (cupin superfamily)